MAHSLDPITELHHGVLSAAALGGCDISFTPGMEQLIGYGDTKYGYGPACLINLGGTPYMAEPHVTWFPWTSSRDRINNFKWAMKHLAESREVLLIIEDREKDFFEHFVKRGLLRKVGHLENIPEIQQIHFYQYKRGEQHE